jgi:hypothetical protein
MSVFCYSLIKELVKLLHLGVTVLQVHLARSQESNETTSSQQQTNKVPNFLDQHQHPLLMVINELNEKGKRLKDFVIFVDKMVIWYLNVSRR